MAEKFFANLKTHEIKAFMRVNHDPRFTSEKSRQTIEDDLNLCLKHNDFDGYTN